MAFRISPLWWPVLGLASLVVVPLLIGKNRRFKTNLDVAAERNRERLQKAEPLDLPVLEYKVFLSAHDSCDYALQRMKSTLKADTEILAAGKTYRP